MKFEKESKEDLDELKPWSSLLLLSEELPN